MHQKPVQREPVQKALSDAYRWADDCLKHIHRITQKFNILHELFSDSENSFISNNRSNNESVAKQHLSELYEKDISLYDDLEKSLTEFRSKNVFQALEYIEIANAYHLEPINVRGDIFLTGTEAVFKIADYVRLIFVRIKLRAPLWNQSEINEQIIRESISEILEIHQMLDFIDCPLFRKLKSQLRIEHIRCERWLSDLYGFEKQTSEDLDNGQTVFTEGQLQMLFGLNSPGVIHVCVSRIDGLQIAERGAYTFHFTLDQAVLIAHDLLKNQTDSSIKENATAFIRDPQQQSSRMLSLQ